MALTIADFEIEVGKHPYKDRHNLVLKMGPHEYTFYVLAMLEKHGPQTVTHCLRVPIVEDPHMTGMRCEWRKAGKVP